MGSKAWGPEPPTPLFSAAAAFHAVILFPPHADDNSNQSSIADASPIKQENSSNSSPAPEPNSAAPGDGTDAKVDEAQADGKELPGAEGTCPRGWGSERPLYSQLSARQLEGTLRRPLQVLAPRR